MDDGTHAKTEGGPQASKFFFAKTLSGTCKFDQIFAKKSFTLSLGKEKWQGQGMMDNVYLFGISCFFHIHSLIENCTTNKPISKKVNYGVGSKLFKILILQLS